MVPVHAWRPCPTPETGLERESSETPTKPAFALVSLADGTVIWLDGRPAQSCSDCWRPSAQGNSRNCFRNKRVWYLQRSGAPGQGVCTPAICAVGACKSRRNASTFREQFACEDELCRTVFRFLGRSTQDAPGPSTHTAVGCNPGSGSEQASHRAPCARTRAAPTSRGVRATRGLNARNGRRLGGSALSIASSARRSLACIPRTYPAGSNLDVPRRIARVKKLVSHSILCPQMLFENGVFVPEWLAFRQVQDLWQVMHEASSIRCRVETWILIRAFVPE